MIQDKFLTEKLVLWKSARGPCNSGFYSDVTLLSANFLTALMQDKSIPGFFNTNHLLLFITAHCSVTNREETG